MKFIDRTEIHIKSGKGGDGLCSFKSAKNLPKLGADGGDGGHGGDVYLVGHKQLNTLSCVRYRHYYEAADGKKGGSNGKTGAGGKPLLLKVPVGTIIRDRESGDYLGEILEDGQRVLVAEGGKRGLGNMRYLSSTHQAPERRTLGEKGIVRTLALELKLMADVGLAGFPNAGKSSLLTAVSSARPRVADYPFTTLVPHLGVVDFAAEGDVNGKSFVMADIPGLIEGASEGRGLGHDFLKHLERTKVLAFVVEIKNLNDDDPVEAYLKVRREVDKYGELRHKKSLIVISKIDLADDDSFVEETKQRFRDIGEENIYAVSSVQQSGLSELKYGLYDLLHREIDSEAADEQTDVDQTESPLTLDDAWVEDQGFTLMTKEDFFKDNTSEHSYQS